MEPKALKIDKEKCVHCGKCIGDCVSKSLEFNADKIPVWSDGGERRCIKCGHCFAICPTGALSILHRNPEDADVIREFNDEDILNLIKSRKSIRAYKKQNLDDVRMNKLKEMLKWTPTGCNFHQLHFAIVDDISVMDDLRNRVNKKIIKALKSKPISAVTQKFSRYRDAFFAGEDVIFRGAPHMVVVSAPINAPCVNVDPIIALSYFELYAHSMGVGTLWCGFGAMCFKVFPDLCEYIKVPDGYKVSYVMLFGEKDVNYSRTVLPDDFEVVSVKIPDKLEISALKNIKRFICNILR
ncbi:MAG: nitroreductase family protein [Candidatus Gastranaerophilales bacterium]|nr:nitroreductase family protein [Candidatus Gastranaerophilales bacterium]